MDAVVFFDDVPVPWERAFLLGDVDMCNNHGNATQMNTHTGHQVTTRCVVKAEFILGLAGLMVETLGSEQLDHVQEKMGELVCYLEILKACVRASEADAELNQWGVMCPVQAPFVAGWNLFPRMIYPRIAEIIQTLGSSSPTALPSEADFHMALTPEVGRYLATDSASARDRASCSTWRGTWSVVPSAGDRSSTSGSSAATRYATRLHSSTITTERAPWHEYRSFWSAPAESPSRGAPHYK